MNNVLILLAAYNGEKYVHEMIDSIIAQDYDQWHLILSDDGSKDATPQILESYAQKFPEHITYHRSGKRFGNAQKHFMYLLRQFHDAPYIMFCDQDDVWHPDKVRKTLAKMQQIEVQGKPAMVHTDLRVVDKNLQEISSSFVESSNLNGNRLLLRHLLAQNVVTGCTMMVNRALAELAIKRIPEDGMLMHDWWLAILAAAVGNVAFLPEATIDYRQHGNNSVGAKNVKSLSYIIDKIKNNNMSNLMKGTYRQAQVFLDVFGDDLPEHSREIVSKFAKNVSNRKFNRVVTFITGGYWKHGFGRSLGQVLWG